ncbi:MAG: amidohydrolase family protein [Gammaproteobacteria bacterium]|nr:amidohydrolase family protein [Gammaproteobacteria bacterium]
MKSFKFSLLAASLLASSSAFAASVAIKNATIFTASEKGTLENASIVFEDGVITAVNPATLSADTIIDAKGKFVTPGFISAMNQIGLVEVGAVSTSRDASPKKADITFDPSYGFNPESSLIPFARKAGITRSVVTPFSWGETFHGQAFSVLMNSEFNSIVDTKTAVVVTFGAASKDSRASSILTLIDKLKGQQAKLEKASDDAEKSDKKPSEEEKLLTALLNGEVPLVAGASRASDILHLINIKKDFGVDVIISGGKDAAKVKTQLAEAKVPVMISVLDNLPGNFDSLGAGLTTAGELEKAGVEVMFINTDSHMIHNLRFDAGNAVSYGMSVDGAVAALTSNVAKAFNMDSGVLAKGKPADVVLWSGDPLELSSYAQSVWINGEKVSTEARHDKLRDRYTSKDAKRRGYIKP